MYDSMNGVRKAAILLVQMGKGPSTRYVLPAA